MGNGQLPDEAIIKHIRAGWSFRVKTVKGRRYITRRKGQSERSMGPFDADLWRRITVLVEERSPAEPRIPLGELVGGRVEAGTRTDSVRRERALSKRLDERILLNRGAIMMMSCLHNRDGWCTYWNWDEKPEFFEIVDNLYGENVDLYEKRNIILEGQTVTRWVLRASLWYCLKCSAYISLGDIALINKWYAKHDGH